MSSSTFILRSCWHKLSVVPALSQIRTRRNWRQHETVLSRPTGPPSIPIREPLRCWAGKRNRDPILDVSTAVSANGRGSNCKRHGRTINYFAPHFKQHQFSLPIMTPTYSRRSKISAPSRATRMSRTPSRSTSQSRRPGRTQATKLYDVIFVINLFQVAPSRSSMVSRKLRAGVETSGFLAIYARSRSIPATQPSRTRF